MNCLLNTETLDIEIINFKAFIGGKSINKCSTKSNQNPGLLKQDIKTIINTTQNNNAKTQVQILETI